MRPGCRAGGEVLDQPEAQQLLDVADHGPAGEPRAAGDRGVAGGAGARFHLGKAPHGTVNERQIAAVTLDKSVEDGGEGVWGGHRQLVRPSPLAGRAIC